MQKKISARIAGWLALTLATVLAVTSVPVMNAHAEDKAANVNTAKEALYSESYDDVNTLNATLTVKNNILTVKKNDGAQSPKPSKVVVNGVTLKLNKNYTLTYQKYGSDGWTDVDKLTKAGTYRMCVIGKGDYTGVSTKRICVYDPVQRIPMSSVKITVNKVSYTGKAITSDVIKSVKYKNTELVEGRDYTVTYLSNVDSGTGIVRISGVESVGYVGERDVKFTITGGTKLSKAKVTGITAKTYDGGNAVTQDMSKVKLTVGGKELTQGTDYVVSYYMNNKKAGTAKIVFAGKGLYNGTLTKSFKINKVKLNAGMLDEKSKSIAVKYTKKAVKPDVTLYNGNGERLVKGVDYTLAYKNNVKLSDKAVITVKGKGNYTGSFKVNFTITDKDIEEKPDKEEKPSEGDGEDEKPSEGGDEGGKPSEGGEEDEKPSEGEGGDEAGKARPGERVCWCGEYQQSIADFNNMTGTEKGLWKEHMSKHVEAGEGTNYTDKYSDGTEVKCVLASRVCQCGYVLYVYTGFDDISGSERSAWKVHMYEHTQKGESMHYTDKHPDGTETEGVWTWDWDNGSGTGDGDDKSETSKSGTRVCQCGLNLVIHDLDNLTTDEIQIWNGHNCDGGMIYTDRYSDGTVKGEGSGLEKGKTPAPKPIGFKSCTCGAICPVYVYGYDPNNRQTMYEYQVWNAHYDENHIEQTNYTSITYEKALKLKAIEEDEDGNWTWIKEDAIDVAYGHVRHYHVLDSWLGE